jgi:signal transduction histidine kinase/CheY-like chemotaxis protein
LEHIETVILPAVGNSVLYFYPEQTRVQLQGILSHPRVVRIQIIETSGGVEKPFLSVGKKGSFKQIRSKTYDLLPPVGNGIGKFAKMTMYTTQDPAMARAQSEAIKYFVSESLETLILSFLILYAFRIFVINHLGRISRFFKRHSFVAKDTPHFPGKHWQFFPDEIDSLVAAINRAIDESKESQAQIEELKNRAEKANEAKSMFLASINHELRTPLNAILGVTELLPESLSKPEEVQQLLAIQKRSGIHLLHLVDEILDFSKIEAGEVKIENVAMDIQKSLDSCSLIMEGPMKTRQNCLSMHLDPQFPPAIMGDPNRINQILINLVSNANKFTDHGEVTVKICLHGDKEYEITVKDTGRGIPKDKLKEIFLPFRQLENSNTELRRGTGIGLSITQSLVEFMGGSIDVESEVGVGSTFRIILPLEIASLPESLNIEKVQKASQALHHRLRVLVVEDTPDVRLLIQAYLRGTDVELTFAQNGQEGVQRFEKEEPSLILMDLQMPVMNGFEATQKIRELENKNGHHHVKILALTALATKGDLAKALQSGCDGYVTKPFSRLQLLDTLKSVDEAS